MLNFKTKEYTFKDTDGKDVNIKYTYNEKIRELLKMLAGSDIENVENLKEAKLIEEVKSIPELRNSIKIGGTNSFGTGGVETKIQAAEKSTVYGIPMLLANGDKENILINLANGTEKGTLFLAE